MCRQLRLRNISGIVIVDFINMKEPEHLKALMDMLKGGSGKRQYTDNGCGSYIPASDGDDPKKSSQVFSRTGSPVIVRFS